MNELTQDTTKVELIAKDISYIQKDIATINSSIKELATVYVTRETLTQTAKETEDRLSKLEKSKNLWNWLSPTLSAALSSAMTFLIIQYLNNLHMLGK
jgi:bacterioferritin (cytochrome b1)